MYESYRIVERQLVTGPQFVLQTNMPPQGYNAFNQFGTNHPAPKWFTVATYPTLEKAQEAKRLYSEGLNPGDKVVG